MGEQFCIHYFYILEFSFLAGILVKIMFISLHECSGIIKSSFVNEFLFLICMNYFYVLEYYFSAGVLVKSIFVSLREDNTIIKLNFIDAFFIITV